MSKRGPDQSLEELSQIVLFADLSRPELRKIDRIFEEEFYDVGRRILRRGIEGSNFYVIVEGEVAAEVDGHETGRLYPGEYIGEFPLATGEPQVTDFIARTPVRCRVLGGVHFEQFMLDHPRVLYRLMQTQTSRLYASDRWHE